MFEGSIDGTNYFALSATNLGTGAAATGTLSPTNATPAAWLVLCPDIQWVRLRATAIASNSVSVDGTADDTTVLPLGVPISVMSADGAIGAKEGLVLVTKGSACVMTLAAPVAGIDDGKTLTFIAAGAFAHTATNTAPGFNNAGAAGDVATFAAALGNGFTCTAYNGIWYSSNLQGVTLA